MPELDESISTHHQFQREHHEKQVRLKTPGSLERYQRSSRTLAGGVSSGMRRATKPYPLFFDHGAGSQVFDVDGNAYLDYGLAWGPLILGHSHAAVVAAVRKQAAKSFTFGAQHDLEFELAELLNRTIPCADLVCYANSGTEIVQVALRLALAITGRQSFLKFEGHYHGWSDEALVAYHPSANEPLEKPSIVAAGQLPNEHVIIAEWNNRPHVERLFAERGNEISAIICEPLLANSGCLPPAAGFLEFLREISRRYDTLLIFDEVITGFRVALGGAQSRWNVAPDLATYAKAVGGGVPLSVLAGRYQYMQPIASGKVLHAGTLNGNPLCLAAAFATIEVLAANDGALYGPLRSHADRLRTAIAEALRKAGFSVITSGDGPVFHVSFMDQSASNYRDTLRARSGLYEDFALALLNRGVLVLPDGRWYVSAAHTEDDIDHTIEAVQSICG